MVGDEVRRFLRGAVELERVTGCKVALFGGCAVAAWATPRATADVNVLVIAESPEAITAHAASLGFITNANELAPLSAADMTRFRIPEHLTGRVRMDVVIARAPFHRRVVERSVPVEVFGQTLHVATAEDLIVLKLLAGRPRDLADVDELVRAQGQALNRNLIRTEAALLELSLPPELN